MATVQWGMGATFGCQQTHLCDDRLEAAEAGSGLAILLWMLVKGPTWPVPFGLEFSGAVYHVTTRGNARQKIFFRDGDRELFLDTLAHITSRYGWLCHAYCLMETTTICSLRLPKPI